MAELTAHKATVGPASVDQKILRNLTRIGRLQIALETASDEKKPGLQAEIDALDASFGGKVVREAYQTALTAELERTRPEREKAARAARREQLQKELDELGDDEASKPE